MNKAVVLSDKDHCEAEQTKRFLVDIKHPKYVWLVQLETASWSLIKKEELGDALCDARFLERFLYACEGQARFPDEEIQCDGAAQRDPDSRQDVACDKI